MKIYFCNDHALPCGCSATLETGDGEYSDSIEVYLCRRHAPKTCPNDDAGKDGYALMADGQYHKRGGKTV